MSKDMEGVSAQTTTGVTRRYKMQVEPDLCLHIGLIGYGVQDWFSVHVAPTYARWQSETCTIFRAGQQLSALRYQRQRLRHEVKV